jgi:hypothetical protein
VKIAASKKVAAGPNNAEIKAAAKTDINKKPGSFVGLDKVKHYQDPSLPSLEAKQVVGEESELGQKIEEEAARQGEAVAVTGEPQLLATPAPPPQRAGYEGKSATEKDKLATEPEAAQPTKAVLSRRATKRTKLPAHTGACAVSTRGLLRSSRTRKTVEREGMIDYTAVEGVSFAQPSKRRKGSLRLGSR